MGGSESRAGWRMAITAYFISRGGPVKLYEGTKMYPCTFACATREGMDARETVGAGDAQAIQ